jgi:hypothetical protein
MKNAAQPILSVILPVMIIFTVTSNFPVAAEKIEETIEMTNAVDSFIEEFNRFERFSIFELGDDLSRLPLLSPEGDIVFLEEVKGKGTILYFSWMYHMQAKRYSFDDYKEEVKNRLGPAVQIYLILENKDDPLPKSRKTTQDVLFCDPLVFQVVRDSMASYYEIMKDGRGYLRDPILLYTDSDNTLLFIRKNNPNTSLLALESLHKSSSDHKVLLAWYENAKNPHAPLRTMDPSLFYERIIDLEKTPEKPYTNPRPAVIMFSMDEKKCGLCGPMVQIMETLSKKYIATIDFYLVDILSRAYQKSSLHNTLRIEGVPFFLLMKEGSRPAAVKGQMGEEDFERIITDFFSS